MHEASRQFVLRPGKVHAVTDTPSHVPPQGPLPEHAMRMPWGAPVTGEQVPSEPITSHA